MKKIVALLLTINAVVLASIAVILVTRQDSPQPAVTAPPIASPSPAPQPQPTAAQPRFAPLSKVGACELLTAELAQAMLQGSATKTEEKDGATISTCTYTSGAKMLRLNLRSAQTQDKLADDKRAFGQFAKEGIAGIGEMAFWEASPGQLNFWQGTWWGAVKYDVNGQPSKTEASAAASRLANELQG